MLSSGGSGHHWVGSFSKLLGLVLVSVLISVSTKVFLFATMLIRTTTFSDGCLGSNNDEGRSEV